MALVGWVVWAVIASTAVVWAHTLRTMAKVGYSFQIALGVQTFFFWLISIFFLVLDYSKLHILWIAPLSFFTAMFLVLVGIPIVSPVVLFLTEVFVNIVLLGTGKRFSLPSREFFGGPFFLWRSLFFAFLRSVTKRSRR